MTLGIPFDLPMVREKNEGIIDVEALIMTTLLMMEHDRTLTDLPAWINRFSSLINRQKLKTMFKTMSGEKRGVVLENLNQDLFCSVPKSFKSVFSLKEPSTSTISETISMRLQKLNTIENVAQAACMIHHRLLYGTGFRADVNVPTRLLLLLSDLFNGFNEGNTERHSRKNAVSPGFNTARRASNRSC